MHKPTKRGGILLLTCGAVAGALAGRPGCHAARAIRRRALWALAWVGLDTLEATGLLTTGLLVVRADGRLSPAAAATAMLLCVDAWFDVTTSSSGGDFRMALVMALCAELPLAALCARLALQNWRRV